MYTLELDRQYHNFVVCEDGEAIVCVPLTAWSTSDKTLEDAMRYPLVQRQGTQLQRLVDLANLALAEFADPMLPDPTALSRHIPTSGIEDARDSAGLGPGPLEPRIRTLPRRCAEHRNAEDPDCEKCAMIREAYERCDVLHSETY